MFWPEGEDEGPDVWTTIKDQVEKVVDAAILAEQMEFLKNQINAIRDDMFSFTDKIGNQQQGGYYFLLLCFFFVSF